MQLPTKIRLTGGGAYLDGGTTYLTAVSDLGQPIKIRLNQYLLAGTSHPGRLLLNGIFVNVRSDLDLSLLSLLESAEIRVERGAGPDTDPNYIGPPIETIEAEHESSINCISELRTSIIDFVRSEQYIEIANHGVQTGRG